MVGNLKRRGFCKHEYPKADDHHLKYQNKKKIKKKCVISCNKMSFSVEQIFQWADWTVYILDHKKRKKRDFLFVLLFSL